MRLSRPDWSPHRHEYRIPLSVDRATQLATTALPLLRRRSSNKLGLLGAAKFEQTSVPPANLTCVSTSPGIHSCMAWRAWRTWLAWRTLHLACGGGLGPRECVADLACLAWLAGGGHRRPGACQRVELGRPRCNAAQGFPSKAMAGGIVVDVTGASFAIRKTSSTGVALTVALDLACGPLGHGARRTPTKQAILRVTRPAPARPGPASTGVSIQPRNLGWLPRRLGLS